MVVTRIAETQGETKSNYDRRSELKTFDDTKAGVKGLVDAGVIKIPRIFYSKQFTDIEKPAGDDLQVSSIPIIDLKGNVLEGLDLQERIGIINQVRDACSNWGFFQLINHGIPTHVMDEIIDGMRRFHEQDLELKKEFYKRDFSKVYYMSNFDLYEAPAANWRDTFGCVMAPNPPTPQELPHVCRDIVIEYSRQVMKLGCEVFELISEALGLKPCHLKDMGCAKGILLMGHYYPPCPEPALTMGTTKHTDGNFMTILMQDQIGGLQVLHEDQWIDVPPTPGALVVNIGDLLQLISNDKAKSVFHRVLAKQEGPRISVPCFFRVQHTEVCSDVYGPIKELLTRENPAVYRETDTKEFLRIYFSGGLDGTHVYEPIKELLTEENPAIYRETDIKEYMRIYFCKRKKNWGSFWNL